jgi:hypothetical protein
LRWFVDVPLLKQPLTIDLLDRRVVPPLLRRARRCDLLHDRGHWLAWRSMQ